MNGTVAIGSLIGAPICGALLGDDYAWWKASVFCGVSHPQLLSAKPGLILLIDVDHGVCGYGVPRCDVCCSVQAWEAPSAFAFLDIKYPVTSNQTTTQNCLP